jgi:hypothetical protein
MQSCNAPGVNIMPSNLLFIYKLDQLMLKKQQCFYLRKGQVSIEFILPDTEEICCHYLVYDHLNGCVRKAYVRNKSIFIYHRAGNNSVLKSEHWNPDYFTHVPEQTGYCWLKYGKWIP